MKRILFSLTYLSLFLFISLVSLPKLPILLSFQDTVDPETVQNYQDENSIAYFNNQKVLTKNYAINNSPIVLGDTTSEKRIEVDLTQQKLFAYEGDRKIFEFLISSGTWDRTPRGEFYIWTKVFKQKMSGGSKELGTYYYLPNVPYVMFFYNDRIAKSQGYSLHGTYWHNNFGTPMSHGCINMKTSDIQQLYYWANPIIPEGKKGINASTDNPGTKVIIYGKYNNKISQKINI